jgi:hypothetical protein
MSTGIKPLDQTYLTGIFTQLSTLEVHLDSDPLVYGPKRLNMKTALVRKMLTDCERVFLEVSQRAANYKRQHRAAKVILDLQLKQLLANDPETRAGRAVTEPEAIAYGTLKEEVQEVADAEDAIEELDAVMQVIKAKRSDLRDIQGRLRDQVRLCQEEIGLGGRWGSKSPRGVELQPGQGMATGADLDLMDEMLQKVREVSETERHLPAEVDSSDTEEEELQALVQSAEEAPSVPPKPILGEEFQAKFGFIPHCAVCGEVQMQTSSGMVCSNGHGGADSVPPAEDLFQTDSENAPEKVLPATAESDAVADFLGLPEAAPPAPKKTRYQVEEEDGMDLESILSNFNP